MYDSLAHFGLHLVIHHHDTDASVVFPATSGPSTHLDILAGLHHAVLLSIPLGHLREDHRLGGHVEAHRECLCREQALQRQTDKGQPLLAYPNEFAMRRRSLISVICITLLRSLTAELSRLKRAGKPDMELWYGLLCRTLLQFFAQYIITEY